jgi:hypothetical protein
VEEEVQLVLALALVELFIIQIYHCLPELIILPLVLVVMVDQILQIPIYLIMVLQEEMAILHHLILY